MVIIYVKTIFIAKKIDYKKLSQCGAYSEETAKTLSDAGVGKSERFRIINDKLENQKILVRTKDNRYYLNK